ncbi:MAG: RNHCP domain-containing protein [Trueperaceae bacterium]
MKRFTAVGRNTGFTCNNCGNEVPPLSAGGCRNHCPYCLYSRHVDVMPGDRASDCGGVLEPIGVVTDAKKGYVIVYRCQSCGKLRRNRAALDDPASPDDFEILLQLSGRPLPGH